MMFCLLYILAASLLLQGISVAPEIELPSLHPSISQDARQQVQGNSERQRTGQSVKERLAAATNLYNLGTTALQNGELNKAADSFREALAIHQELAPLSLELARDLNGLGDISEQRGEAQTAQEFYERALAILRTVAPDGDDFTHSLYGLGRVMADREDWDKAGPYLLQALDIRQKLKPEALETAAVLNILGDVYGQNKEPAKAEQFLQQASKIENRLAPESLAVADTLTGLGRLATQSDLKKAEKYHREALVLREKLAPNSLAVANSLWWLGWCTKDPAASEEFYRRAIEMQTKLAPSGIFLAKGLAVVSHFSEDRGDRAKASEEERQALAILEKQAPDSLLLASSLQHLGQMLLQQGALEQGENLVRRALLIAETRQPDGYEAADSLSSLGDLSYRRGELDKAEEYHQRALKIREKLRPGSSLPSMSLRSLGYVAKARGDLDKAEHYHRQALAIREKLSPGNLAVANSLSDLGFLAQDRGDLLKAEQLQQKALKIWEQLVPGSLYVAQGYNALGNIAEREADFAKAEDYQRKALAIWEKLVPGSTSFVFGLNTLGGILRQRGDPVKAAEYQQRALEIEKKDAPGSPMEALVLVQLGHSIQDQGDLAKAEEYYRQALAIREKYAPGTTIDAETLAALATNLRRQNRLQESAQFYAQALNALESQTARLGGGDEARSSFRATYASYYKDYIDLLVTQDQPEIAFQVLERFRARSLLEALSSAHVDVRDASDSALSAKARSVQQSLVARVDQRLRMLGEKHSEQQIIDISHEIDELLSQYKDLEEQLQASSARYAALTRPPTLSARQVQEQLLDTGTLLLEYSLGEQRSYVFAVGDGPLAAYELPKRDEVERAARRVYDLLTIRNRVVEGEAEAQRQTRIKKAEEEFPVAADELGRMILGPLAGQLGEKRLLIVSDGALQYIPFAVLPSPGAGITRNTAEPLLVKHEIVSLPSASVLAVLRREEAGRKPPPNEVAVFADPVFDKHDRRVAGRGTLNASAESIPLEHLTRSLEDIGGALHLPRLPFSRLEANGIMAVIPSGKGKVAVDFQANRAAVTNSQLAQYRIIHFATHGLLDSRHPELSGLVMSLVDKRGRSQNGFLELQDIYNLRLPVELVVLSACETALGKEVSGEGLIGLTRGFMYAGASRVVASLWSVSDVATAKLMTQFYKEIERDKASPAAALRSAQISLWQQDRWQAPYYWGAFQIQGEWR